ncbi:MAG TPA: acetolactate synthase small subunit [Rhodanobacteraceae bacterium]|nr:acetolactate synthase small subunit [Rhodanobacteraceae bacterium]
MRRIISMLLQNEVGALGRVAGLFSARGYNIDSLTVATTHDAAISRLTLVTAGDDAVISQIIKQSRKIVDVLEIVDLTGREHLETELVMVKVDVVPERLVDLVACLRRHPRAQVLDISAGVRTAEFTGDGAEIDAFLADIARVGDVLEIARSGTAAIERGTRVLAVPVST